MNPPSQIDSQYILRHWVYPIVLTAVLLLIVMAGAIWGIESSLESTPDGGEEAGYFVFFTLLFAVSIVTPFFAGSILGYQQDIRYETPFSIILTYTASLVIYSLHSGVSVVELMSFIISGFALVVLSVIFLSAGVGAVIGSLASSGVEQLFNRGLRTNDDQ